MEVKKTFTNGSRTELEKGKEGGGNKGEGKSYGFARNQNSKGSRTRGEEHGGKKGQMGPDGIGDQNCKRSRTAS